MKKLRKARDLTQEALAQRVYCAVDTIRKIETGLRRPSRQLAGQFADCLGLLGEERVTFLAAARAVDRETGVAPGATMAMDAGASLPLPSIHRSRFLAPTTSFIGRATELAAVRDLLARPTVRLLTLSGSGGTGKTRLALQVAAELLDAPATRSGQAFADGMFFVDLAPLSDPALVIAAIAESLGVRTSGDRPLLVRVKDYLQDKHALLVLDNFEHLLPAAPLVTELLTVAPKLKILVTSRAMLHLSGEWDYAVPPLSVPDPHHLPPLERLAEYEAVQLFVERASAVKTNFGLGPDAAAVAEICRKVDGLPLAIELAAARVRVLPPQTLLRQLHSCLHVLTGGTVDAPARQRTLRATIDWSYQLLATDEQTLFQRLAVFAGGCTLEAAAVVGNSSGTVELLNELESLVDKHLLIQPEGSAEPRFRILETIREYAVERLIESGEVDTIRRRHAHYFMELAEAAEPHLYGTGQRAWLRRLELEHDNLRAALDWAAPHASALALRLAGALGEFWHLSGYHREGRDWLLHALEQATDGMRADIDRVQAKALNQAGYLAIWLRDFPQATTLLEQSMALWRVLGEPRGLARALRDCGLAVYNQGKFANARALLEESIAAFRQVGDQQGLGLALFWHGRITCFQGDFTTARASAEEGIRLSHENGDVSTIAACMAGILFDIAVHKGDYQAAQSLATEGLRLYREEEDKPGIMLTLGDVGSVAYLQGQYDQAKPCFEEQLLLSRELDSQHDIAWSVSALGYVALRQNDGQRAAALFAKSLALRRELSDPHSIATCLAGLAEVAEAAGQLEQAAQLLGATQVLLAASGRHLEDTEWDIFSYIPITSQAEFERHVAAVRAALGDEAFAAAWTEGRTMTLEQALTEVLGAA
jgi:non-specific serine/threonine protein kinase